MRKRKTIIWGVSFAALLFAIIALWEYKLPDWAHPDVFLFNEPVAGDGYLMDAYGGILIALLFLSFVMLLISISSWGKKR